MEQVAAVRLSDDGDQTIDRRSHRHAALAQLPVDLGRANVPMSRR
jgi:hypothetical protein